MPPYPDGSGGGWLKRSDGHYIQSLAKGLLIHEMKNGDGFFPPDCRIAVIGDDGFPEEKAMTAGNGE